MQKHSTTPPMGNPVRAIRANDMLFWTLKESYHLADALLTIQPKDGGTTEHLLVMLSSKLEDLMDYFDALQKQDELAAAEQYRAARAVGGEV